MKETCSTCKWYREFFNAVMEEGKDGICIKRPPQVVSLDGKGSTTFPRVYKHWVCGEWQYSETVGMCYEDEI